MIGVLAAIMPVRLFFTGVRTTAVVVWYEGDSESIDSVVEFEDSAGGRHRCGLPCSQAASVGMVVKILYDPLNPKRAIGDCLVDLWGFPASFAGLGGLCLALAWFA